MSPTILDVKKGDLANSRQRSEYTICITGCRRNGVLHACLFAKAGFNIICADTDRATVDRIGTGKTPFLKQEISPILRKHVRTGNLEATCDLKAAVSKSDIIVLIVQPSIRKKRRISRFEMERTCKKVGSGLQRGSLIIVMSLVKPATTERFVRDILENTSGLKAGTSFGLVYVSPPISTPKSLEELANCKRIVGATEKNSLEVATIVMETIMKTSLKTTDSLKAAETATLLKSVQYSTNVALANELARFCEEANMDYYMIQRLTESNPTDNFFAPYLSRQDQYRQPLHLMNEGAEDLNIKLQIPAIAKEINEGALKHAVDLVRQSLRSCGKSLTRARVTIFGISQTRNRKDIPSTSATRLAKTLEKKGCRISFYDPYISGRESIDSPYPFKKRLKDAVAGVDCIVILTGHRRFKRLSLKRLRMMARMPAAIVDLEGVIDPEKVEREGCIYRGLGRGVWTK